MAVPKRKTSPMKRGQRRSADALKAPTYVEDKDSGELRRPHHVDLKTGKYRGRQILKLKSECGSGAAPLRVQPAPLGRHFCYDPDLGSPLQRAGPSPRCTA